MSLMLAPNLAEIVSCPLPSQARNPIKEKDPFDMIDLMLDAHGEMAGSVQQMDLAVQV